MTVRFTTEAECGQGMVNSSQESANHQIEKANYLQLAREQGYYARLFKECAERLSTGSVPRSALTDKKFTIFLYQMIASGMNEIVARYHTRMDDSTDRAKVRQYERIAHWLVIAPAAPDDLKRDAVSELETLKGIREKLDHPDP